MHTCTHVPYTGCFLIRSAHYSMNGIERVRLQRRAGVRGLVEEIDSLKLLLGVGCVSLLTPKAEVTLRKGEKARIPLVVSCILLGIGIELILSFPIDYPDDPFEVQETKYSVDHVYDEEMVNLIQDICHNIQYRSSVGICSSIDLVKLIRNFADLGVICGDKTAEHEDLQDPAEHDVELIYASSTQAENEIYYRTFACRMCRKVLLSDDDLSEHNNNKSCRTLFLSELPQNSSTASEQGGKILCPCCNAKLGAWSWVGTQCSCKFFA